jgi:hypothetical protein
MAAFFMRGVRRGRRFSCAAGWNLYGFNLLPALPSPGIESLGLRVPTPPRMNQMRSVL